MNPNLVMLTERFVGVCLVVLGLSHIVCAALWASLFKDVLATKPWAGLAIGTLTLPFGLAIVLMHNVWVAHPAVLTTIVGWGWTIKGTLYLLAPQTPERVSRGLLTAGKFRIAGVFAVVLGAAICVGAFLPPG